MTNSQRLIKTRQMQELVKLMADADVAYYKHDSPIMTDREYDTMYERLLVLEKETGITLSGSPTQKTSGEVLESLTQVRHTRPMLSVQKTKSIDDIHRFLDNRKSIISWKLDGLTLVLRYENGRFAQAITRGGGDIGEDVTHTVRVMTNVPMTIPSKEYFEVRGEGIVSWKNFNDLNDSSEEAYAHPRNMTAGAIRRLNANKTKIQRLEFHAFELVSGNHLSKTEEMNALYESGFSVVPTHLIEKETTKSQLMEIMESFNPANYDYPVDGLIIEYDDLEYGKSLGATGHHENRAMAYKWADELHETTFLGLELATTRTGMVSPTAILEDVVIDGTTINRAYLHNLNIMDNLKLGIGDRVQVYKANMIIPQIAENLTRSGTLMYPTQCPCCKSALSILESDSGTRLQFCMNNTCPAKLIRKFVHFCSKSRMDIPDLSEKRLQVFINSGWIKNFGDLFELKRHREAFVATHGFGEKLFERITKTIDSCRECELNQFLSALGIPQIGRTASRTISAYFNGDWDAFEQAINDKFDFTQLEDFGQTMHDNIFAWYANKEEEALWRPALQHITFTKTERINNDTNANNPFSGKTVVTTGKLENYTRDGISDKLLSLGAKPGSSVSKSTDYLIVGEKAGSKLARAEQFGVVVLTEAEFEMMLEGSDTI